MTEKEVLSSLSETVKQLLIDGVEARKMEDEYMVSMMYNKGFSYCVAHLTIPFKSGDDLLKKLLLGLDCVDSLRFY